MVTIYEVAQQSGVSTATVSRVIHDGKGFSDATRERVLAAIGELGWVPNGSARGLVSRRSGIVGLLFPDLATSGAAEEDSPLFVDQIIRGAERAATLVGDAVLIAATHSASGRSLAYSVASKVDGLVVLSGALSDDDLESIARSLPVVVLAGRPVPGTTDFVGVDNVTGTGEVTTHLIEIHRYRDILFLGGPPEARDSTERFDGFVAAMEAAGLPVRDAPDAEADFTEVGGERAMRALLADREPPPRAVVCANDQMAIGAVTALRAAGLRVPADTALTGFDDIASTRYIRPTLTTVRQPMVELGARAVRVLLDRLEHPGQSNRSFVLPTQVVIRRSCGCRGRAGARPTRSAP